MNRQKALLFLTVISIITFSFRSVIEKGINGWFMAGSAPESYEIGLNESNERTGKVAYLKSTKKVPFRGFGTMMQMFTPDEYLGKRVKLSAYIKSVDVNKGWAGMWMRVDGSSRKTLSFDNMQDRPIRGSQDWKKYEIILDVPKESQALAYGVLLNNTGAVYIDDFSFMVVGENDGTTGSGSAIQLKKPTNTNFEEKE